jgi:4-hydroxy-tetrahydrodipicolinate synthase
MEETMPLQGSIVALVTPFKNGEIDDKSLLKLLDFQIESKTDGILIAGTTGEAATLSAKEFEYLLKLSVKHINGRLPVLAGTGSNNTSETIKRTKLAAECGADYALVVSPYYNKPTDEGIFLHYKKIAENSSIPVILYNVPSRTGSDMSVDVIVKLSSLPNIIGIKEASGNVSKAAKIIAKTPEDFSLFSGDDGSNFPIIAVGGKGAVSVVANVIPAYFSQSINLALEKNWDEARKIYHNLHELCAALFIETNPAPAKAALHTLGIIDSPEVRLPLAPATPNATNILKKIIDNL